MREILRDRRSERKLVEDGFFVADLLTEEQVEQCLEVYEQLDESLSLKRYNTLEIDDYEHRKEAADRVYAIIQPMIADLLVDYKLVGLNFAAKKPADDNPFPPHFDDVHVDESKFISVNIWIPLVPVSPENGGLYVLPRSYKVSVPVRGIGIPFPYLHLKDRFNDLLVYPEITLGQALVFQSAMIHGSGPNLSKKDRPAIIVGTIPDEAMPITYIHYEGLAQNEAELFHTPPEFFNKVKINERPQGFDSLGIHTYGHGAVSDEEFFVLLNRN